MLSHMIAKLCGLRRFPKAKIFETTDSGGRLVLQGYKNVPVNVPRLPTIFAEMYETFPNAIYNDTIDTLTTELFTANGYIVAITDTHVLFE